MSLLPMALVAAALGRGGTAYTVVFTVLFSEMLCSPSGLLRDFRWEDVLVSAELK